MTSAIRDKIQEDMKVAMRSGDKDRLGAIRLIWAALKQREVDERIVLTDEQVMAVLDKMLKQRRDSIAQYQTANRQDLVQQETDEVSVIQEYMPSPLSTAELETLIDSAIRELGATSIRDMGKVMNVLKPKIQGRTDLAVASNKVKDRLSA